MKNRPGLTLVELLVVIAIIGLLVGLLMPAVQSARESGRRLTCANNLKQMGIGMQQHIHAQEHLPTGGWGEGWTGDPNRGYGFEQPGGWIYNLLPYMDSVVIRDRSSTDALRRSTALPFFNCPSRRSGSIFEVSNVGYAKTDYGANTVNGTQKFWSPGCITYGNMSVSGPGPESCGPPGGAPPSNAVVRATATAASSNPGMVGVVFRLSTVRPAAVLDGLANTYFGGEKTVRVEFYTTGQDSSDRVEMYRGGFHLIPNWQPQRDPRGSNGGGFGSAHADVFNALFCDGSVKAVPYAIDQTLHQRLCNRKDGQVLDLQGL